MKCTKFLMVMFLVVSPIFLATSSATAQVFLDLYGGVSFAKGGSGELKAPSGSVDQAVEFEDAFVLGGRVGSWGTDVGLGWLGMAVDVSYWQSETKKSLLGTKPEGKILPVTVLLMFRYPGDKVQPYAGIGGGVFLSQLKTDIDLSLVGGSGSGSFNDYQADVGFDARAGLAVKVHKKISIFAEGRYIYSSPKYEDDINGQKVTLDTEVEALFALAGLSFHF